MTKRGYENLFSPQPKFTHCRVCNCKLNAAASKANGLCRFHAQELQHPKPGPWHLRRGK